MLKRRNKLKTTNNLFYCTCGLASIFLPLDIIALNVTNLIDWLLIILHPHRMLGAPPAETHRFLIFAIVACNYLWFTGNKAHYDDIIPNALIISTTINKTTLEHYSEWTIKYDKTPEVWKSHSPPYLKINYDTVIRTTFSTQVAICKDSTSSIITCTSLISSPCSALYGEATAALLAAHLVVLLGLSSFILEDDSLNATMILQHLAITTDWRIASTISNIHSTIPPTVSEKASHVN
jgi:hypothetical protein